MKYLGALLAAGLLLALAAVPGVCADTAGAKPVNEAITATRGELEALKSRQVLPIDQMPSLSGLDAPAFSIPAPPASTAPQPSSPTPAPAKSAGWLLEAMEKTSARSTDAGGRNDPAKSLAGLESGDNERPPTRDAGPQDPLRGGAALDFLSVKNAPNPLASYLSGWMTPRDFNLLLTPDEADRTVLSWGSPSVPGQGTLLSSPAGLDSILQGGADGGAAARTGLPAPVENPYLQMMEAPLPRLQPPPDASVAPPSLMARPAPPPAASDPAAPFRAELQKREDDAKYFPQLKRF